MAVISTDTFQPLNRYVGVRLQQGVPIVDADWNELEDVRKFEVRAFLKWFVGNGIPDGSDGFRIDGTGASNSFTIRAGITGPADGLSNVGRCLVDGLDVLIDADLAYTAQPLHTSQPGAAALAAQFGVPVIPALAAGPAGTVIAFLDVWERLLTPTQEPDLIHPGLGTESCARLRREWVVRTRTGTSLPVSGDADFRAGHSYYALATITRRLNDPVVNIVDVTDQRERRLLTLPSTLTEDLFGTPLSEYRRGRGRPAISLREAINAILRGEFPASQALAIAPAAGQDIGRRGFVPDATNGILAFWTSNRAAATDQIFAARLDMNDPEAGFGAPIQVTTGTSHSSVSAALTLAGDLFVVYQTGVAANADVSFKRGTMANLTTVAEAPVANTAGTQEGTPFVVVSDQIAMVFYHAAGAINRWNLRRRNLSNNTWVDNPAVPFGTSTTALDFHAVRDSAGNIWAAYRVGNDLRTVRITPSTGAVSPEETHDSGGGNLDEDPFLLPLPNGDVWLFWRSPLGIHVRRFIAATSTWEPILFVQATAPGDLQPTASRDVDGGINLIWNRSGQNGGDILLSRHEPGTANWFFLRSVTFTPDADAAPYAFLGPDGGTWVFWTRAVTGNVDLFFRRVVTAL